MIDRVDRTLNFRCKSDRPPLWKLGAEQRGHGRKERDWRIWCQSRWNIYATHIKYSSLDFTSWSCDSSARLALHHLFTSPVLPPPTFLKGLCVFCVTWKNESRVVRVRADVLGDDGKCLCLRARGSNIFQLAGADPAVDPQTWRLKVVRLPLAHKTRTDSLSEERASDWKEETMCK